MVPRRRSSTTQGTAVVDSSRMLLTSSVFPSQLTIIPRTKGSLGFAQYLPNESSLESKSELLDRLCMILGGRIAEEEFFGSITTGAYDDLKRAYELCHALVTKYGMSEKLGYVGYLENDYSKTYSDQTNQVGGGKPYARHSHCHLSIVNR